MTGDMTASFPEWFALDVPNYIPVLGFDVVPRTGAELERAVPEPDGFRDENVVSCGCWLCMLPTSRGRSVSALSAGTQLSSSEAVISRVTR